MTVVWIVLAGSVGAALGFVIGKSLAARAAASALAAAANAADELGAAHARELAARDAVVGERDAEIARRRDEIATLVSERDAALTEGTRRRRWAEDQFKVLLAEFQTQWAAAALPTQVHLLGEMPAEAIRLQLESLAGRLRTWVEELGTSGTELQFQLGMWNALNRRWPEAAEHFQQAALKGMGVEAWLALGDAQWELERPDRARTAYKNCLHLAGVPEHVLLRYARIAADRRDYKDALVALEKLLERAENPVEVYSLAALAYSKVGQDAKAVKACETGQKAHAGAADLHAKMILPLARLGERDRAESSYLRALELDARCAEAPFAYGVALVHLGDEKGAKQYFRDATELDPQFAEAWCWLGVVHNNQKQYKKALPFLDRAVAISPDYAEAYYRMKETYEGMKDFDKAVAMLRKATSLDPAYQ